MLYAMNCYVAYNIKIKCLILHSFNTQIPHTTGYRVVILHIKV